MEQQNYSSFRRALGDGPGDRSGAPTFFFVHARACEGTCPDLQLHSLIASSLVGALTVAHLILFIKWCKDCVTLKTIY